MYLPCIECCGCCLPVSGLCGFLPVVLGLSLFLNLPLDFCKISLDAMQIFVAFLCCTHWMLGWVHDPSLCYLGGGCCTPLTYDLNYHSKCKLQAVEKGRGRFWGCPTHVGGMWVTVTIVTMTVIGAILPPMVVSTTGGAEQLWATCA